MFWSRTKMLKLGIRLCTKRHHWQSYRRVGSYLIMNYILAKVQEIMRMDFYVFKYGKLVIDIIIVYVRCSSIHDTFATDFIRRTALFHPTPRKTSVTALPSLWKGAPTLTIVSYVVLFLNSSLVQAYGKNGIFQYDA